MFSLCDSDHGSKMIKMDMHDLQVNSMNGRIKKPFTVLNGTHIEGLLEDLGSTIYKKDFVRQVSVYIMDVFCFVCMRF